jgi:hypothetical protein
MFVSQESTANWLIFHQEAPHISEQSSLTFLTSLDFHPLPRNGPLVNLFELASLPLVDASLTIFGSFPCGG